MGGKHKTHDGFKLSTKEIFDFTRRSLTKAKVEKKSPPKKSWFIPSNNVKIFFQEDEVRNNKKGGVLLSKVVGIEEFKDPKAFEQDSNKM